MKMRDKALRKRKRITHIRKRIFGTPERPRLVVSRSGRHIYAQIIDDQSGTTLGATSTLDPDVKKGVAGNSKVEAAKIVGIRMAEIAKGKGIEAVVFDRHGFLYHGRVKALADGARKGGLEF
jgi:large subunit ribosomal protein L18